METTATETTPRIWYGCLPCYNAGTLAGAWFDIFDRDGITAYVKAHRADHDHPVYGPHEEWEPFDLEGIDDSRARQILYADDDTLDRWRNLYGEHDADIITSYLALGLEDDDPEVIETDIDDRYAGHWSSVVEYAEELADDIYYDEIRRAEELPWLRFDYEAFARDLEINGDIYYDDDAGIVWRMY